MESLRKEAKRWLKSLRAGDADARARLARAWPDAPAEPALRDVQHALALERGFSGWTALVAGVGGHDDALRKLLRAAVEGNAQRVAELADPDPKVIDERGLLPGHTGLRTALHYGVGHEPVVRALLQRGANPNIRDEGDFAMPLHFAAERQDLPVIRLLIEHGADPIGTGDYHELDVIG